MGLSKKYPGCVYYVFPLVGDVDQLVEALPDIRSESNFTLVETIGRLKGKNEEHDVEVWHDRIEVHSPIKVQSIRGTNLGALVSSQQSVPFQAIVADFEAEVRAHYVDSVVHPTLGQIPAMRGDYPQVLFLPTNKAAHP